MLQNWLIKFRRYPLLQRVFVNSGLAAVDGILNPKDFKKLAVIPPFAAHWDSCSGEEQRQLVRNFLSIYLHNAINAADFPSDKELHSILHLLERAISDLRNNSWCQLLTSYGDSGKVPDKNVFMSLDPATQVELGAHRNEWESIITPISEQLIAWIHYHINEIQAWHAMKLRYFN